MEEETEVDRAKREGRNAGLKASVDALRNFLAGSVPNIGNPKLQPGFSRTWVAGMFDVEKRFREWAEKEAS